MPPAGAVRAGRAFVELLADDSKLMAGLRRAQAKLRSWGAAVQAAGLRMIALGTAIAGSIVAAARSWANAGGAMLDMSQRTGLTVEALSELSYAARQSGASVQDLEAGIRRMQRSITEAADGSKTAQDALAALGLSAESLKKLSPEKQFALIARRLNAIADPTRKAGLAMELLGRGGTALIPMMANMDALRASARRLGLSMSTTEARAAKAFSDALTDLWDTLKRVRDAIGAAVAPLLMDWAKRAAETAAGVRKWIQANRGLVVSILKIALATAAAGAALVGLGMGLKAGAVGVGVLIAALKLIKIALAAVVAIIAFLTTPIGLAVAGIATLGGAILYWTGAGARALGWLGEVFGGLADDAKAAGQGIGQALAAGDIGLAARILWLTLKMEWQKGVHALNTLWVGIKSVFWDVWDSLVGYAIDAWYGLQVVWEETCAAVRVLWESAIGLVKIAWARAGAWLVEGWISLKMGWSKTCEFFAKAWAHVVAGAQTVWAYFLAGLQKAWNILQKIASPIDFDLGAANEAVDRELEAKLASIQEQKDIKLQVTTEGADEAYDKLRKQGDQVEQEYQDRKKAIATETADTIAKRLAERDKETARLKQEWLDTSKEHENQAAADKARREKQYRDELGETGTALENARKEWQDALDAAQKAGAAIKKPPALAAPGAAGGIADELEAVQRKVAVTGTFSAAALWGMTGTKTLDRIAAATEKTAANTGRTPPAEEFS